MSSQSDILAMADRTLPLDLSEETVVVLVSAKDADALAPSIIDLVASRGGITKFGCLWPTKDYEKPGRAEPAWIVRTETIQPFGAVLHLAVLLIEELYDAEWALAMLDAVKGRLKRTPIHVLVGSARIDAWLDLGRALSQRDFSIARADAVGMLHRTALGPVHPHDVPMPAIVSRFFGAGRNESS